MAEKQEWFGVYAPDGEGEPIALFRDAQHAQQYRRTVHGRAAVVETADVSIGANRAVRDLFRSRQGAEPEGTGVAAAEAVHEADLRSRAQAQAETEVAVETARAEAKKADRK